MSAQPQSSFYSYEFKTRRYSRPHYSSPNVEFRITVGHLTRHRGPPETHHLYFLFESSEHGRGCQPVFLANICFCTSFCDSLTIVLIVLFKSSRNPVVLCLCIQFRYLPRPYYTVTERPEMEGAPSGARNNALCLLAPDPPHPST